MCIYAPERRLGGLSRLFAYFYDFWLKIDEFLHSESVFGVYSSVLNRFSTVSGDKLKFFIYFEQFQVGNHKKFQKFLIFVAFCKVFEHFSSLQMRKFLFLLRQEAFIS